MKLTPLFIAILLLFGCGDNNSFVRVESRGTSEKIFAPSILDSTVDNSEGVSEKDYPNEQSYDSDSYTYVKSSKGVYYFVCPEGVKADFGADTLEECKQQVKSYVAFLIERKDMKYYTVN